MYRPGCREESLVLLFIVPFLIVFVSNSNPVIGFGSTGVVRFGERSRIFRRVAAVLNVRPSLSSLLVIPEKSFRAARASGAVGSWTTAIGGKWLLLSASEDEDEWPVSTMVSSLAAPEDVK